MRPQLILTLILLFAGCHSQTDNSKSVHTTENKRDTIYNKSDSTNPIKFKKFIAKFKLFSLPFVANTECYDPDTNYCKPLDMDNDSIFIGDVGESLSVGLFPDTSNFYAVIFCAPAVCYLPILAVYSKDGHVLGKQDICSGCGAAPGYTCFEKLTVNSLTDIAVVRKEEYYKCDSTGKQISNTPEVTFNNTKYSISKKGIIYKEELSN